MTKQLEILSTLSSCLLQKPKTNEGLTLWTDLVWVNLLNQSLQAGHPTGGQVTVLEEHPLSSLHGAPHHGLSARSLQVNKSEPNICSS